MQMPKSAKVVPTRSTAVFRRNAHTRPIGKATRSEMAIASSASWRLGRSRRPTFSSTGSPFRIERPRSPRSTRPIHVAYWRGMARSRPSSARRAAFAMASCDSPSSRRSDRGRQVEQEKTPAVTSSRRGWWRRDGVRIRRPRHPQPDVLEPHHPVGDRFVGDDARLKAWLVGCTCTPSEALLQEPVTSLTASGARLSRVSRVRSSSASMGIRDARPLATCPVVLKNW